MTSQSSLSATFRIGSGVSILTFLTTKFGGFRPTFRLRTFLLRIVFRLVVVLEVDEVAEFDETPDRLEVDDFVIGIRTGA